MSIVTDLEEAMGSADPRGPGLRDMKTFKPGVFWKSKSQGLWFYPVEDQKNGGVSGLQLDLEFSKKPKKKSLQASEKPRGSRPFWDEATPPEDILALFKAHPEFK